MQTDIHSIMETLKTDPAGISMKFGIPLRTVYGWSKGNRTPPDYVIAMMLNIILLERRSNNGNSKEGLGSGMEGRSEAVKDSCKKSESTNGET